MAIEMKGIKEDIQDYFISILTFVFLLTLLYIHLFPFFFIFQFNMMEDKEDQSLLYQLNGKIIESEFLACCMCSSFKWDYGNGKNSFFLLWMYVYTYMWNFQ